MLKMLKNLFLVILGLLGFQSVSAKAEINKTSNKDKLISSVIDEIKNKSEVSCGGTGNG